MIKMTLTNDEKSREAAEFLWKCGIQIRRRWTSDIFQTETRSNGEALPIRLNITNVSRIQNHLESSFGKMFRDRPVRSPSPLLSLYKNNKIKRDAWHLIFISTRQRVSVERGSYGIDPRLIRIYCHVTKSTPRVMLGFYVNLRGFKNRRFAT